MSGNHSERDHALLSASSAHRWLHCPPSARMEDELPDSTGDAAKQGTVAHELAEHKLRKALKLRSRKPRSKLIDEEMEEHTDAYRDYILDLAAQLRAENGEADILLEERVDYSHLVPEGFGTADCLIISDGQLYVIDFKYGQGVLVDAAGNPQMRLYALGAMNTLGMLYDIDVVHMTIFQPRRANISTETLDADELTEWGEQVVRPAAAQAYAGEGDYKAGDWCGFCKLKNTCRKRAEANLALAQYEFAPPAELSDAELAVILEQLPQLTKWAKDVESYTTDQAINHGKTYPGFKVVEGRSIRKYSDPDAVAAAAENAGYKDIWDKKLIGITAMEKYLGKAEFQKLLGELVIKPAGKPALVPESDRRPPLETHSAADDFAA